MTVPRSSRPGEEPGRLSLREAKEVARRLGGVQPQGQAPTRRSTHQHWRSAPASDPGATRSAPAISAKEFKDEVRTWAVRLEVEPAEVHLTGMHRKWASCSPRGRLTFDTALLEQPEDFRREAIVHELLHLKVPNHGPLFRALLTASLGRSQVEAEPSVDL